MQGRPDIEALKVELADTRAMLADIESGKNSPCGSFGNREIGIRQDRENRITNQESRRRA